MAAKAISSVTSVSKASPAKPKNVAKSGVAPNPRVPSFHPALQFPDIRQEDRVLAQELINLLPADCRNRLKNFYVRYDKGMKSRGYANEDTVIILGTTPLSERRGVETHEMLGHFFDLGCLRGTAIAGASEFRDGNKPVWNNDPSLKFYRISWLNERVMKPGMLSKDFASGYAKSDAYEDVAESIAFYVLHRDAFEERAKKSKVMAEKLAWMKEYVMPGVDTRTLALSQYKGEGPVPWDVTKLSYVWQETQQLVAAQ